MSSGGVIMTQRKFYVVLPWKEIRKKYFLADKPISPIYFRPHTDAIFIMKNTPF